MAMNLTLSGTTYFDIEDQFDYLYDSKPSRKMKAPFSRDRINRSRIDKSGKFDKKNGRMRSY